MDAVDINTTIPLLRGGLPHPPHCETTCICTFLQVVRGMHSHIWCTMAIVVLNSKKLIPYRAHSVVMLSSWLTPVLELLYIVLTDFKLG